MEENIDILKKDRENQIIIIKAQIFDLQVQSNQIRRAMDEKLKELNELLKKESP